MSEDIPIKTTHCTNAGLMLVQRRRRWTSIEPALAQCLNQQRVAICRDQLATVTSSAPDSRQYNSSMSL